MPCLKLSQLGPLLTDKHVAFIGPGYQQATPSINQLFAPTTAAEPPLQLTLPLSSASTLSSQPRLTSSGCAAATHQQPQQPKNVKCCLRNACTWGIFLYDRGPLLVQQADRVTLHLSGPVQPELTVQMCWAMHGKVDNVYLVHNIAGSRLLSP